jgi:acetylornithine/succinyldiaminopimelate/putrescine aminotransferase
MKKRTFNKHLNACRFTKGQKKGLLDIEKLRALDLETRQAMGRYVIGHRGPVLVELTEGMDREWLASMAYFHRTQSKVMPELTFIHSSEQKVR